MFVRVCVIERESERPLMRVFVLLSEVNRFAVVCGLHSLTDDGQRRVASKITKVRSSLN